MKTVHYNVKRLQESSSRERPVEAVHYNVKGLQDSSRERPVKAVHYLSLIHI